MPRRTVGPTVADLARRFMDNYAPTISSPAPPGGNYIERLTNSASNGEEFSLRGLANVRGEWDLVCLALNIKRMGTVATC